MRKTILSALLISALAAPALADSYPVTGAWGPSTSSDKGAPGRENLIPEALSLKNFWIKVFHF